MNWYIIYTLVRNTDEKVWIHIHCVEKIDFEDSKVAINN